MTQIESGADWNTGVWNQKFQSHQTIVILSQVTMYGCAPID